MRAYEILQRYKHTQVDTEHLFLALLEESDGAVPQILHKLGAPADIISRNPAALQLRYLQTLLEISGNQNSTVIFPLPIDLLSAFQNQVKDLPSALGGSGGSASLPE